MPELDTAALGARLAGLPKGPWLATFDNYRGNNQRGFTVVLPEAHRDTVAALVNAFLADSRTLVEQLLARVRELEGVLADLADDTLPGSVAFRAGYQAGQEDMQERAARVATWSRNPRFNAQDLVRALEIKECPEHAH